MLLLALSLAHAQTLQQKQSGPTIEIGIGPSMVGPPVQFAVAGQLSLGWWFGPYDDSYALGRFNAVVLTQRLDWIPAGNTFRYAPQLELRRGMDLLAVAPHYAIAGGPLLAGGTVGFTAQVGGGLKIRRSRRVGITARLMGGVDWLQGRFAPSITLTIGGGFSTPVQAVRK